jgi:hypothetical protein
MPGFHKEILTAEQIKLLPMLGVFSKDFGLAGGTAIALHLGHRRSIDFDMFSNKPFGNLAIRRKIAKAGHHVQRVFKDEKGQYTFFINGVQFTFFHYPYPLRFGEKFDRSLVLADLPVLAAMKAFALGRRAKWKDYVDLYFIIKNHISIKDISRAGERIFGDEFNEKIFRNQLVYFNDIDYREAVEFMPGFEVSDAVVKKALVEFSLA